LDDALKGAVDLAGDLLGWLLDERRQHAEVGTGAEHVAVAAEHDGFDVAVASHLLQAVAKLAGDVDRQGVAAVGASDGDRGPCLSVLDPNVSHRSPPAAASGR